MPRLREDIRRFASAAIDTEAAKDRDEVGQGFAALNVREDPADMGSKIIAWRVVVSTDNGLEFVFPDIPADREPTDEEAQSLIEEYGDSLVAAIKARRAERKAAKR